MDDYQKIKSHIEKNYKLKPIGNDKLVGGLTRAGMYKLFADLGFKKGAEVGVQRGRNAWIMYQNIPDLELLLVDPYKDHQSNARRWGKKNHKRYQEIAVSRFKKSKYDPKWMFEFSEKAAIKIKDESLDFVYIDGEHTYDFVMMDLIMWYRKIRKGGIISGHDYLYNHPKQFKVYKALNHFLTAYRISQLYLTDNSVIEHPGDKATSFFFVKEWKMKRYFQKIRGN